MLASSTAIVAPCSDLPCRCSDHSQSRSRSPQGDSDYAVNHVPECGANANNVKYLSSRSFFFLSSPRPAGWSQLQVAWSLSLWRSYVISNATSVARHLQTPSSRARRARYGSEVGHQAIAEASSSLPSAAVEMAHLDLKDAAKAWINSVNDITQGSF